MGWNPLSLLHQFYPPVTHLHHPIPWDSVHSLKILSLIVTGQPIMTQQINQSPPLSSINELLEENPREITLVEIDEDYHQQTFNVLEISGVHTSQWEMVTRVNLQHLFKQHSSSTASLPITHPLHLLPAPSISEANPFKMGSVMEMDSIYRYQERKQKQKDYHILNKENVEQEGSKYSKTAKCSIGTPPVKYLPSHPSTTSLSEESSLQENQIF